MANVNKVFLMGNLTRDPQLKSLPSGTQACEFGMAMNRRWKDKQTGEASASTTFVDCKVMGRSAEVLHQYAHKGDPLFVEGSLDYRTWEANDGSKRSKLEVFVLNFQLLGGGGEKPQREAPRRAAAFTEPRTGASLAADDDTPF